MCKIEPVGTVSIMYNFMACSMNNFNVYFAVIVWRIMQREKVLIHMPVGNLFLEFPLIRKWFPKNIKLLQRVLPMELRPEKVEYRFVLAYFT